MSANSRAPSIKSISFDCPHCGAFSHQNWYLSGGVQIETKTPNLRQSSAVVAEIMSKKLSSGFVQAAKAFNDANKEIFIEGKYSNIDFIMFGNIFVSECVSCKKLAVWCSERMVYPSSVTVSHPHPEMPEDIRYDFNEARQIFHASPRGSAALLRLCIQKLCIHLGEKGKNIDDNVANLVSKGLNRQIQQALDIVRVVGNEAVHPGSIDLNDVPETAQALFDLVNEIVEETIAKPKRTKAIYDSLPSSKRAAIERRDARSKGIQQGSSAKTKDS
jgi:hypothetical protein